MQIISSSDARNNFAKMLDKAQYEPIAIQKQGHNTAILISYEEYERLTSEPISKFQDICKTISKNAKKRGLTDKIFANIMAENE